MSRVDLLDPRGNRCREFPALAMKAIASQPMSALTTIQLREHAAAIKWLVFSKIKAVR